MPDKRFSDPPIIEVVCGVLFDPIEELDPVLVGRFWESQLARFPRKQLLPAIAPTPAEGLVIELGPVPPLRTWLISEDDTRIMQIQADRFYLNWRKRESTYPSFNRTGDQAGLREEVLEAFRVFASFLRDEAGLKLVARRVEMSMYDMLAQGRHWRTLGDLQRILPGLGPFVGNLEALPPVLQTVVEGPIKGGDRRTAIQRAFVRDSGADGFRIETTVRLDIEGSDKVEEGLGRAHVLLKSAFDELIPRSEHYRFETGWRPE